MSSFSINPDPTMTRFLVEQTPIFKDCPVYVADVGSRDGYQVEWKIFGDCLRVYCFEPDEAECARLNATAGPNIRYLPAALAAQSGEATLYEAKLNYSTGLYKTDMSYFSRLLNRDNGVIVGEHTIRVFTLDEILQTHNVGAIDFIKLDAEGAELDILRGGERALASPNLSGILSEIRFQREINHSPIFSDLDVFLRPHGFHLYDLQFHHQSRHCLPYPGLQDYRLPSGERFFAYTTHGQIMDGDALYFRDLLTQINVERRAALSAAQLLKYAAFFEIYSFNDCAAELLIASEPRLRGLVDLDRLLDLLTPPFKGQKLGYQDYRSRYFGFPAERTVARAAPRAVPAAKRVADGSPLVSIVMFCRNGAPSIQRSIESVLNQSYANIEFVIQDSASTDGTLEILQSYGDRLNVVSEPDAGTNDGFWRALLRCRGDVIGTCLADEELLPDAVAHAVAHFQDDEKIAAVTGDAHLTDVAGKITGKFTGSDFDFLGYLLGDYCPNFAASFFRSEALRRVGMFERRWKDGVLDTVEFEIWCRLGCEQAVKYVPEIFAKYAIHPGQMSHRLDRIVGELASRSMIVDRYLFGPDNFFGNDQLLRDAIIRRQHEIIINHLDWNGHPEEAEAVRKRYRDVMRPPSAPAAGGDRAQPAASAASFAPAAALPRTLPRSVALSNRSIATLRALVPQSVRSWVPLEAKLAVHDGLRRSYGIAGAVVRRLQARGRASPSPPPAMPSPGAAPAPAPASAEAVWQRQRAQFYHEVAIRFRDRGQIEQAWLAWTHARDLNDLYVDSMALQALMKAPTITDADLLERQRAWAEHYARPLPGKLPASFRKKAPGEKIVVGYHCGFWHINTGKSQALPFIAAHDRDRFKIIGYSPNEQNQDVRRHFDEMHVTGALSDGQFVDLVRSHDVDVLVELTGLSYLHRFTAMASRCAPVQVSYLNHTGTTGIEYVDYVIADDIAAPRTCDPYYTETIYRLPRCFFGFSYNESELPPIAPPPVVSNGYVTFGCFGGGDKLNADIIKVWAALLRRNPSARLIIQNPSMSALGNRAFLLKQFRALGIENARITVLPGADRDTILRNYALMDISLDTYPYCGGNTIAESVWQGVPVVSYHGNRFPSAYGASLLHACGLSDLVAQDFDDYVRIADRLGRDPERLSALRPRLRDLARQNGLSDCAQLARALEAAYADMVAR